MKQHYWIVLLIPLLLSYTVIGNTVVDSFLAEGTDYLTKGEYNEALNKFDAAIEYEPDNYISYFKRATTYLSLGRNQAAIDDLSTILSLKPDFYAALLQRSRLYLNEGEYRQAKADLKTYLHRYPKHKEATKLLDSVETGEKDYRQALHDEKIGLYDICITHSTSSIQVSPSFLDARMIRARCHLSKGETEEAVSDYVHLAQLNPSNTSLLILLARLKYFSLNEPEGALLYMKQCLRYDPEAKDCKRLFRTIKKMDKDIRSIEKDIELKKYVTASNHLIGTMNRQGVLYEVDKEYKQLANEYTHPINIYNKLHLKCYQLACELFGQQQEKEADNVIEWCSKVLSIQDDVHAFAYRGETLLNRNDYTAAIHDLEKANELSNSRNQHVLLLLNKAQQKLKQSKKRDYYRILDISPNADLKEIKKAYRKKAHEWHPDKYNGELSKDEVQHRMSEINQAYEVLSDPDMRQQYDNGQDPYDSDNTGGSNPFQSYQGSFQFPHGFPFNGHFPGQGQSFKMRYEYQ